ncbi:Tudor domain-containing protein 15 [Merluccius polli]|uniref:Tudor domain-containing protein 15 n=1 Tax=Merluccius polli TaxID=89951 RepID=A0AA47N859_MERPO|nr:Tudor domain-containing protein 15 [Merluccius polli]
MDLKMFSIPEPPAPRSEVAFVISRVGLESRAGLVELLVDLENRTEEPAQTSPDGADPQTPHGPGRALTPHQSQSPPPPYLFTCYLANVLPFDETWSEKATIFLKSVLEKPMSGLVEDVLMPDRIVLLDIPLISKFLSRARMAKKIEAGHFKSLDSLPHHAPQTLNQLMVGAHRKRPDNTSTSNCNQDLFENVEVTQVTGPLSLFCKLSIFSKELKKLSKQMQLHYNGGSAPGRPVGPQASGSPCAARDMDGTWRRSRLTQDVASGAGSVEVLHVDHGETQLVPPSAIRPLHQNFLRIPVVTYHCALHGVHAATWHRDQMDYLNSLLRHAVVARFELYDVAKNMYDVTLFGVEAECINAYFTEKSGVPSELRHSPKDSAAEDCTTPPGPDDVDKSFSTKVTLTNNRFLRGSMSPNSDNPPANRRTDDDKCVDKNYCPTPSPIRKENANSEMIQSGHGDGCASPQSPSVKTNAIHEDVLPVGSCVAVKVSFIVSPAMFFCQLLDNRESFVLFMKDLQSYYANSIVEKPVGDFCVAWHPDNRMWYRGRIIDHGSLMMDVRFIDYGQTCMVPVQELRPIDPRFMRLNSQAFRCCLHNPLHPTNPSAAPWTEGATEKFHKFIDSTDFSNDELKCTVKATTRNPQGLACSVVDLKTPLQCLCNLLTQTTAVTVWRLSGGLSCSTGHGGIQVLNPRP